MNKTQFQEIMNRSFPVREDFEPETWAEIRPTVLKLFEERQDSTSALIAEMTVNLIQIMQTGRSGCSPQDLAQKYRQSVFQEETLEQTQMTIDHWMVYFKEYVLKFTENYREYVQSAHPYPQLPEETDEGIPWYPDAPLSSSQPNEGFESIFSVPSPAEWPEFSPADVPDIAEG